MSEYKYFKYRFINKNLIDSLVNGSLYFSLPSNLNDPFDCQINIRKSATFAATRVTGVKREILQKISTLEDFEDEIQRRMEEVGVCSFSLNLEESLLWSHYADEHRGFCLGYEFSEKFFLDRANEIVGVSEVKYGDNSLSDWMIENIPDQVEDSFYNHFTTELLKRVLVVKADGWHYENECRIIRQKSGPFIIPQKCLKQVCFGMHATEADMQLVRKIVDGAGYTVDYLQICKTESDFGIRPVEI